MTDDDNIEFRYSTTLRFQPMERILEGTIVRYGDRAQICGVFAEEVRSGAFNIEDDIILNLQHKRSRPLARTGNGLSIHDGEELLGFRAVLPNTRYGDVALELIQHKLLRGVSLEMRVKRDEWHNAALRVIHEADLVGLAIVDKPAYPQSSLSLRTAALQMTFPIRYWS